MGLLLIFFLMSVVYLYMPKKVMKAPFFIVGCKY